MARSFYEDEEHLTPLPGTTQPATKQELDSLSPRLVNGASVRSPSFLQSKIESIRTFFNQTWISTEGKLDQLTTSYHTKEQHFSTTIAKLHDRDEDLLPGSIYIAIAALTGSIITRRSNIVFRGIAPVILGTLAFKFALPITFKNSTSFLHKIEHENLPQITNKQDELVGKVESLVTKSEEEYKKGVSKFDTGVEDLKRAIKKYGGLNVDEVVTKK